MQQDNVIFRHPSCGPVLLISVLTAEGHIFSWNSQFEAMQPIVDANVGRIRSPVSGSAYRTFYCITSFGRF